MIQATQAGDEQEIKLYVKAPKVYPRETDGRFSRRRCSASGAGRCIGGWKRRNATGATIDAGTTRDVGPASRNPGGRPVSRR